MNLIRVLKNIEALDTSLPVNADLHVKFIPFPIQGDIAACLKPGSHSGRKRLSKSGSS